MAVLAKSDGVGEECSRVASSIRWPTCPPRLIEPANPKKASPWTHKPVCLEAELLGSGIPELCVYTASKFNRKGISFVVTPNSAIHALEKVQNSTAVQMARSRFTPGKPPYQIKYIPEKGKGAVATRLIQPFEVFMEDFPSLVVDNLGGWAPEDDAPREHMNRLLSVAADQLGDRERVLSLATSGRDTNIVADVIATNSFGIDLNGRDHKGLYPEISVSTFASG